MFSRRKIFKWSSITLVVSGLVAISWYQEKNRFNNPAIEYTVEVQLKNGDVLQAYQYDAEEYYYSSIMSTEVKRESLWESIIKKPDYWLKYTGVVKDVENTNKNNYRVSFEHDDKYDLGLRVYCDVTFAFDVSEIVAIKQGDEFTCRGPVLEFDGVNKYWSNYTNDYEYGPTSLLIEHVEPIKIIEWRSDED